MSFAMVHDFGTVFSFPTKPGTAREVVCRLGLSGGPDKTETKSMNFRSVIFSIPGKPSKYTTAD